MSQTLRLARISIALNIISLLVFMVVITDSLYQTFTLATKIFFAIGAVNLTISIITLMRSLQQEGDRKTRRVAMTSFVIANRVILVIGILLLNILVFNLRS